MLGRRLVLGWGVLMGLSACAPQASGTLPDNVTGPGEATRRVQATIIIPLFNMSTHMTSGCYSHGGKKLKFRIGPIDADDARTWQAAASEISTACDWSAPWDGKWYYQPMSSYEARTILIGWKNVSTGDSDFLAIKYDPPAFVVLGKGGVMGRLKDRGRKVYHYMTGGTVVNVEVENMPDDDVWKPNEVKWRILR